MTCREFIEFLDDYFAGRQPPEVRARFETHLSACRHCVEYLHTYRQTVFLSKAAFDVDRPVPHDTPEELVQAVMLAKCGNLNENAAQS